MPECTLDDSPPIQSAVRFATAGPDSQRVILPLDRLRGKHRRRREDVLMDVGAVSHFRMRPRGPVGSRRRPQPRPAKLQTSRSPACNMRTASSNPCPISSTFLPPAAHEHVLLASLDAHRRLRPQVKEESKVSPEAGRSDVVASPQPVCAVCGGPRDPRKRETCSDKSRTELSRRRRKDALRRRDGEIRALLAAAPKKSG